MHARVLRFLPAITLGLTLAGVAGACGDKLVGLGGGVPFARIHPEHYVGHIVLFMRQGSELRSVDERMHLSRRLQRDGHVVRMVDNDRDLEGALRGAATDLVLADQKDAADVIGRLPATDAPILLSLVGPPATASLQAQGGGPGCAFQVALDESKLVATALQTLMTRRQSGAALGCASNAGS